MMNPTNGDYLWVHDQHEKWDAKVKESLQHLDQIIDSHLGWYNTHTTASDIIRTRRAMPDLSSARKPSRKRKLSDTEEPAQVTEDVFIEEDNPTDKSDQEENDAVEKEKGEDDLNNNQMQEEIDSRESDSDHVESNTEDNDGDDHMNSISQQEEANPEHTNKPVKHNNVQVVIRSSILDSLDKPRETPKPPKPPKSNFISRLLNLNKSKASSSSSTIETTTETTTETDAQVIDNASTTEAIQPMVEADNNQAVHEIESSDHPNEEHNIVVSEVVPEPRPRFLGKKKKTQEQATEQATEQDTDQVSKADTSISSTTTNGSNKVIREIDDDEETEQGDNSENKGPFIPEWAESPELERHLEKQQHLNPEMIFGPLKPIKLKDIFHKRLSSSSTQGKA